MLGAPITNSTFCLCTLKRYYKMKFLRIIEVSVEMENINNEDIRTELQVYLLSIKVEGCGQ